MGDFSTSPYIPCCYFNIIAIIFPKEYSEGHNRDLICHIHRLGENNGLVWRCLPHCSVTTNWIIIGMPPIKFLCLLSSNDICADLCDILIWAADAYLVKTYLQLTFKSVGTYLSTIGMRRVRGRTFLTQCVFLRVLKNPYKFKSAPQSKLRPDTDI